MTKNDTLMEVKFRGVRGSVASPLTTSKIRQKQVALVQQIIKDGGTERFENDPAEIEQYLDRQPRSISGTFGGNTSCVEVRVRNSPLIVIDAGTGIISLGDELKDRIIAGQHFNPLSAEESTKTEINLLSSHYHRDHLEGLPFFKPAYMPGVKINFYGHEKGETAVKQVLQELMRPPFFPVDWNNLASNRNYQGINGTNEPITIGNATVNYGRFSHPEFVIAYRISAGGKSFVYGSDVEDKLELNEPFVQLASGADLLYKDGQYTDEEYLGKVGPPKKGWGHSTITDCVRTALAAKVIRLIIGHHDPPRGDAELEILQGKARHIRDELVAAEYHNQDLEISMAYEGLEQRL